MKNAFSNMLRNSNRKWALDFDQQLLAKYLYNVIFPDLVAHDSYLCGKYESMEYFRPFPSQRLSHKDLKLPFPFNFVGSNGGSMHVGNEGICPEKCRPQDHKDWILC